MFPAVRVKVSNLNARAKYIIAMDMVPADNYRYKYQNSRWITGGKADSGIPNRIYVHPDSPCTGGELEEKVISFHKIKLTNSIMDRNGYTVLNSMHKYQPRIHLVKANDICEINYRPCKTFIFEETQFIAVTAYQNERITHLKIQNNPFAKGFRESGAGHKRLPFAKLAMKSEKDKVNPDGEITALRIENTLPDELSACSPPSTSAEEVKVMVQESDKIRKSHKRKEVIKTPYTSHATNTISDSTRMQEASSISPHQHVGWPMELPNENVGQQFFHSRFPRYHAYPSEGPSLDHSYSGSYFTSDPSQHACINTLEHFYPLARQGGRSILDETRLRQHITQTESDYFATERNTEMQ